MDHRDSLDETSAASLSRASFEKALKTVKRATDEGAILQIDMQDFEDAMGLLGGHPKTFFARGSDLADVIEVCRRELRDSGLKGVVVMVISGPPEWLQLAHCTAVFQVVRQTVEESVLTIFGVVTDVTLQDGMMVTCLLGAPD